MCDARYGVREIRTAVDGMQFAISVFEPLMPNDVACEEQSVKNTLFCSVMRSDVFVLCIPSTCVCRQIRKTLTGFGGKGR